MADPPTDLQRRYQQAAAERAVELVRSGMTVGLGTGRTATFAVRRIGQLLGAGELHGLTGVPTSAATAALAVRLGIPIVHPAEDLHGIDLTIDGADEVDPELNLIKGGGGALLREKIVAQASRREVIVVDESKLSPRLGSRRPLPVEVVPFHWQLQAEYLQTLGARVSLRRDDAGEPFRTDQGNLLLDCVFEAIVRPAELAARLDARAGIAGHGLFLGLATDLIVAGEAGISQRTRP
jgi:ribose 5-phosphate isomerase A